MLQYNFKGKSLSVPVRLTAWNFHFRLYPGAIKPMQLVVFLQALAHDNRIELDDEKRLPLSGAD